MSLGYHVGKGKSHGKKKGTMIDPLRESIEELKGYGVSNPSAQIFVSGPRTYAETLTLEDKNAIRKFVADNNIRLVIHGAYIDYPWTKSLQSINNVKTEMQIAYHLGATGVIVHLGAGAYSDDNLQFALEEIGNIPDDVRENVILWLEINTAKPSPLTYETPAKLKRLFDRCEVLNTRKLKLGLCIDTAHLYSCGVSLDTDTAAKQWLDELPDVPVMMHLNDSASELGSGVDLHFKLCGGGIWKDYHPVKGKLPIENSGLTYILGWAEMHDINVILERDESVTSDLTLISQLGYFK